MTSSRQRVLLTFMLVAISLPCFAAPSLRVSFSPGSSTASLFWTPVAGASYYDVERTSAFPSWSYQVRLNAATSSYAQASLGANTVYLYRIVPRDASLNALPASNVAIVTTHNHMSNPLSLGSPIKLENIAELRTALAALQVAAGAGAPTWTNPVLTTSSFIADEDIYDLRTSFNAAATNLGLPVPSYVDASLAGQFVKHEHIQQVRDFVRSYPENVTIQSVSVSEAFFSPNGDGTKDSSTFSAAVAFSGPRSHFRWRLDIRHPAMGVVRNAYGSGTTPQFAWDGRDNGGAVQPEAPYTFELIDLDSLSFPIAAATSRLDVTAPTAAITSPGSGTVISNVRSAGSGDVAVNGSATDDAALDHWNLDHISGGGQIESIMTSTASVNAALLATWQTIPSASPLENGEASLRLTVDDKAGNRSTVTIPVTIGHFTVTRLVSQANVASGQTVGYRSLLPFPLTERIEIRRADGSVARALVDSARTAGTYIDTWDAKDDQGVLVADGLYKYVATATEGGNAITWDRSAIYPTTLAASQHPYPKCWNGTVWLACSEPIAFPFDPYAGKPLRIAFCVGAGEPDTGCTGSDPALVVVKTTSSLETTAVCDAGCILQEYQPAGRGEIWWYGQNTAGTFVADQPRLTVIRQYDRIAEAWSVLYGTAPVIQSLTIEPLLFSPGSVPAPVGGQVYTLNLSRFDLRPVTVTATFRNMQYGSVLRTITTAVQASNVVTVTWDGRADNNGPPVAPGRYDVTLTVTDSHGSKAVVRPIVVVRY